MTAGLNAERFGSSNTSDPRVASARRDSDATLHTEIGTGFGVQIKSNSTYFDLDFYRYAGAVIVALDHIILLCLPVEDQLKYRIDENLQPLMGFFFTLSGFVIMHMYDGKMQTSKQYDNFIIKRLARMYPLHILTLCMWVVFDLSVHNDGDDRPVNVISNIFLVHAWNTTKNLSLNYPSWSVSAEFFVYLLFPIFLLVVNRAGAAALALPVLAAAGDSIVFHSFNLGDWTFATCKFGCLRAVPSFIAGMVAYRVVTGQLASVSVPAWVAHGIAIATLPLMLAGVSGQFMLAFYVVVVILLALAEPKTPGVLSRPWARALANSSYGFYMLHAFVALALFHMARRFLHIADPWKFALAPLAIALTTAAAIYSFRLFEDPARKYFSKFRIRAR
jgi:peptidoglycan/LPS O-acetylase OafA/YrhL